MSLNLRRKKVVAIPPLANGTYMAVCVGVVDLGKQYSENYKNYRDKLLFLFEIPSETVTVDGEEKPRWVNVECAAALGAQSNLYKYLTSWLSRELTDDELSEDGSGFDIATMLGKPCTLSITVKEGKNGSYNKVENIAAIPKGIPEPTTDAELLAFDIDDRNEDVFNKLPEWIQNKVKRSAQYAENPPEENIDFPKVDEATGEVLEEECPI